MKNYLIILKKSEKNRVDFFPQVNAILFHSFDSTHYKKYILILYQVEAWQ